MPRGHKHDEATIERVFYLRDECEMSWGQISAETGFSKNALWSLYHRMRDEYGTDEARQAEECEYADVEPGDVTLAGIVLVEKPVRPNRKTRQNGACGECYVGERACRRLLKAGFVPVCEGVLEREVLR